MDGFGALILIAIACFVMGIVAGGNTQEENICGELRAYHPEIKLYKCNDTQ